MVQQDLLEWPGDPGPNVHKDAKDTELAAAEFIAPKRNWTEATSPAKPRLSPARPDRKPGCREDGRTKPATSKPRLTELQRMGLVADSGERARNERKRQEVVWKITDKGIDAPEHEWLICPQKLIEIFKR